MTFFMIMMVAVVVVVMVVVLVMRKRARDLAVLPFSYRLQQRRLRGCRHYDDTV